MTQIQRCRDCGDFYRIDDEEMQTIETDDGWGIEICRQCADDLNISDGIGQKPVRWVSHSVCDEPIGSGDPDREALETLDEAWDWWYAQQLDEEAHL